MGKKPCIKVRHATKTAALITARRGHKGEPMNAYWCDNCSSWHLGSSNTSFRIQDRFDRLLANPPKLKRPLRKAALAQPQAIERERT